MTLPPRKTTLITIAISIVYFMIPAVYAGKIVKRQGQPDVHMVMGSDPEMKAAIKRARSTVNIFIKKLVHKKHSKTYFSIKAKFSDGDNNEHMWLTNPSYKNGKFHGQIGNKPIYLKNYAYGDRVSVAPNRISDWMIIENNKLIGGYTIRLLRNRLAKEERARFDQSIGFKIE